MPFGRKRSFLDPFRTEEFTEIDFDIVWRKIIIPAIPPDFRFLRSDQSKSSGLIDKIYIEHLLNADVVLADVTFANPNVYYELGIRHSLRIGGAVLVAHSGTELPFDIKKLKVLTYNLRDATSVNEFQSNLRDSIIGAMPHTQESPVHIYLPGLFVRKYDPPYTPEAVIADLKAEVKKFECLVEELKSSASQTRLLDQVEKATERRDLFVAYHQVKDVPRLSLHLVERLGIKLRGHACFHEAIHLFTSAISHHGPDPVILRELGFCHRKLGPDHFAEAQKHFQAALEMRAVDPELRGMIGGMYKRQNEFERALEEYLTANTLFPDDLYTLVNLGAVSAILGREDEARTH